MNGKRKIAIIVPDGWEVVVVKPGQATMGARWHGAVVFDGYLDGWDGSRVDQLMRQDWFDCQFLTRLAPNAHITHLARP